MLTLVDKFVQFKKIYWILQTASIIHEFQVLYNYVILSINDAIHVYYIWRKHCYFNLHILYFNIIHIGLFLELNHLMTWEEISCIYLSTLFFYLYSSIYGRLLWFLCIPCVSLWLGPHVLGAGIILCVCYYVMVTCWLYI